jgi:hypothetical protein
MGENDKRNYSKIRNIIRIGKDTDVGKSKYQMKIQNTYKYIPFIKQSNYNINLTK